jgi:hypothetical protein
MDDWIVWAIIIAFYAPLHFLMPVLLLFITGSESDEARRGLIRRALIDSGWSMALAFVIVIYLAREGSLSLAMLVMLLSMGLPFVRIWQHRREIRCTAPSGESLD